MIKRLAIYLNEMFPVTSFIGTLLTGFAIQLVYLRLYGLPAQFHHQMILSAIFTTAVSLLIRVMDEFKDYPDDLKNYPHRPLPSGRVKPEDLKALGWFCFLIIPVLSLTHKELFIFSWLTLVYTFLMLKWFFIEEKMRKSLPLAFITHHPIVLFNIVYLLLGMIVTYPQLDWSKSIYILPVFLIFTNWELARKIRMPEQETEYVTYSQIFGPKRAISLSLMLQLIFSTAVFAIFQEINSPWLLRIIFGLLMGILSIPYVRFLFTLRLNGPLKKQAENQVLAVIATLMAAALL